MFQRALSGSGGGASKYACDEFTTNTSGTTKVTLGFKPKTLIFWTVEGNQASFNGIYEEDVSTTNVKYLTASSANRTYANLFDLSIPNTSNNQIHSIDDDGFTWGKAQSAGYVATIRFWAIG